jgi:tetratricopeptide (TPR) repeat protein
VSCQQPARLLAVLAFCASTASSAHAQCADGSPPPCGARTTVAPAVRRLDPPIDEQAWIIVPFDNLAKAEDVEWLRNAAVNLLYLDMSRWRDIRVIDDERVADILRETPEAVDASSLSLRAGLAVAKRAGAGRLVMGDVLKVGRRTAVTAKVFNVRTGQRLRSVREETAALDSVMALFGKLAQRILDVAPPPGADVGALGTTRVDAYQEYLAGVQALNQFDLRTARARFEKALALDSTFALAHYKMSITIGWDDAGDPKRRTFAEAASRFSVKLPVRERSLIAGVLQESLGNWTEACRSYAGLLATDSLDVEARFGFAECQYHDPTMAPVPDDTLRFAFRADWQRSIRAFERVLQLDPQYHLAYQHIIDALTAHRHSNSTYCVEAGAGRECRTFTGYLIRDGDSLAVTPVDARDTQGVRRQAQRYTQTRSRARNVAAALAVAEAWVRAAPNEERAHLALGGVLLLQGQVARADSVLRRVSDAGSVAGRLRLLLIRMEIAYKLGRFDEAVRVYDSGRASTILLPGGTFRFGNAIAGYGPAFGRLAEFDSLMSTQMMASNAPPVAIAYQRHVIRAALGAPPSDSLVLLERAVFDQVKADRGVAAARASTAASLMVALRAPRARWPDLDTASVDPKLGPVISLASGDTARLRSSAGRLDSLLRAITTAGESDTSYAVIAADAYLALGDSAFALRVVRFALDTAAATVPYFPASGGGLPPSLFAPRLMLLRADLARARGLRDEARVWYDRFIQAWSTAVPELLPVVERARTARSALGGS